MCLAIPTQIVKILDKQMAIVSLEGVKKEISLALLTEEIQIGDYVIVHVGYALNRIDEIEAQKTLAYFRKLFDEANYQ